MHWLSRSGRVECNAFWVKIGLWCSDSCDNSFDDFRIQDVAGPFEVDGRWFSTTCGVYIDRGASNRPEFDTGSDCEHELQAIRRR